MDRVLAPIVSSFFICGVAVYTFVIYNYTLKKVSWPFAPWQIAGVLFLLIAGAMIAKSVREKSLKKIVFFINAYTILICLIVMNWGFEVIGNEEVFIMQKAFRGTEAAYQGKIAIVLGFIGIVTTILFKFENKPKVAPLYLICVSCQSPCDSKDALDNCCQKCGGVMESVDGFYERHPDLEFRKSENEVNGGDKFVDPKENLAEAKEKFIASQKEMFTEPVITFGSEKERRIKGIILFVVLLLIAVSFFFIY